MVAGGGNCIEANSAAQGDLPPGFESEHEYSHAGKHGQILQSFYAFLS